MNFTFILFRFNQNKALNLVANVGAFITLKNQPYEHPEQDYVDYSHNMLYYNTLNGIHICHEYTLNARKYKSFAEDFIQFTFINMTKTLK